MSTTTLYRWAGIVGIIIGVLNIIVEFVSDHLGTPLDLLVVILALWALVGLYLRQRQASGLLGFIGYLVNALGIVLFVGVGFSVVFIFPSLDPTVIEGLFGGPFLTAFLGTEYIFVVGVILFGVATIRAGVLPKWAAVLYMVGFLVFLGDFFLPDIIFSVGEAVGSIGIIWLSYALWGRLAWSGASRGGRFLDAPWSTVSW